MSSAQKGANDVQEGDVTGVRYINGGTSVGMSQSGGASQTLSLSSEPITVLKITDIKISDIHINFESIFRSYHSSEDI